MARYVGRRIIPTHGGVWDQAKSYEELTIVLHSGGDSYISRRPVPAGTVISDENYWMLYSKYSEQVKLAVDNANAVAAAIRGEMNTQKSQINTALSEQLQEVTERMEQTEETVDVRATAAEKVSNDNKTELSARMSQIETRQEANVRASTDADADYAAEVVDARVDVDGKTHDNLGTALRAVHQEFRDHPLSDYPFVPGTDFRRAYDNRPTIFRGAIRYFRLQILDQTIKTPLRLGVTYSYGDNHRRCFTIADVDGKTIWQRSTDMSGVETVEYPLESIEINSAKLKGQLTVDWSLVAHSTPININTDFIYFSDAWVTKADVSAMDDYPFEAGTNYNRSLDDQPTIYRGAVRFFHVSLKKDVALPLRLGYCYSYGQNKQRYFAIWNNGQTVLWSYTKVYGDEEVPEFGIESYDIDNAYMVGRIVIDWSKVTRSYPITTSDYIYFSSHWVDDAIKYKARIDEMTQLYNTYESRYPFAYEATLDRSPQYPEQMWYTKRAIRYLQLPVMDTQPYYFSAFYRRHASSKNGYCAINSADGRQRFHIRMIWERDENDEAIIPDEEMKCCFIDSTTGEVNEEAYMIVNWAEVNQAAGAAMTLANGRIREECILRRVIVPEIPQTEFVSWAVPLDFYCVVGKQMRIYFDEICTTNVYGFFAVSSTRSYPQVTYSDDYLEFNTTETGDFTVTIKRKDYYNRDIGSVQVVVHSINEADLSGKKFMFIGDSLTAATWIQNTFKDLSGCTLYGTRGTAPYLHEGRSGWTSANFLNDASKSGATNAFYNPTKGAFDFAWYMDQHPEFADVDVVNIFLGRNDGFNDGLRTRLETLMADIHAYNPEIIITVMGAYNVAADNSGAGKYLQNNVGFNISGKNYNRTFFADYADRADENVYPIPQALNLDSKYDYGRTEVPISDRHEETKTIYTDNVHPARTGYQHMADVYFAYMNHILA